MTRLRAAVAAVESTLRTGLALAESRLALISAVLLTGALVVVSVWWGSLDEVRNLILILAAVIGLPFLTWRARVADRQAATGEKALLDTRFDRAVEMLASPLETVREAGRLRIAELAGLYPDDYGELATVLLRDEVGEMPNDGNGGAR